MPLKKSTAKKRTKAAVSKQDEALEELLLTEDGFEDQKPKAKTKSKAAGARTKKAKEIEVVEEEREVETEGGFRQYVHAIHWTGVGIFAAASLAAVFLGILLSSSWCAGFMQKFLFPWKMASQPSLVVSGTTEEVVRTTIIVTTDGTENKNVVARPVDADVTVSQEFSATGSAPAKDARSTGTVTITNIASRSFTFVATTRLLSQDGVLFRLKSQVVIPANGSVQAEVVADVAGVAGDIGPSLFTFPGLTGVAYEQVSAKSLVAMSGGDGTMVVVSDEDLARAKTFLVGLAEKELYENLRATVGGGERLLRDLVVMNKQEFELPEVGKVMEKFTGFLKAHSRAIIFPEVSVEEKVRAKYMETHSEAEAGALVVRNLIYVVQAYDVVKDRAEVRVEAEVLP